MRTFGFALVVLAGLVFIYQGVGVARRGNVVALVPVMAVKVTENSLPLFPFWAGWTLVGGTLLIAVNEKPFKNLKAE